MLLRQKRGHTGQRALLVLVAFALFLVPVAAIAAGGFTDVDDDSAFIADIQWMKDNGVTKGCNPPTNDKFCPGSYVTREQMSAFMHRIAVNQVVDAGTVEGMTAAELKGQTGDTGPAGADGAVGAVGPAGADGADSTVPGPIGPAGADGAPGGLSGLERVETFLAVIDAHLGDNVQLSAACPSGKTVTGGGGIVSVNDVFLASSFPASDMMSWHVEWQVANPTPLVQVWAFAMCADVSPAP